MNSKHTQLPWKINRVSSTHIVGDQDRGVASCGGHFDNHSSEDCTEVNEANAEFIVRAANSHYQLIAACEPFAALLEAMNHPKWMQDDAGVYGKNDVTITIADLKRAAAALRAAKEQ